LAALEPWRRQAETMGWEDERLKVLVLQALALQAQGELDQAVHVLVDALTLAEPGGFIRSFADEGPPMARLLRAVAADGMMSTYVGKLLAVCEDADCSCRPPAAAAQPLIEPLSQRELDVLRLIAQGCSNRDISQQLFLALDTVKGHNRKIFGKLQVQRRTEAVARARELGLL
jgi:LuxR family maltose regulon positive regulatory protein